jgi:hypothetical protein
LLEGLKNDVLVEIDDKKDFVEAWQMPKNMV